MSELLSDETLDDLLLKDLKLIQKKEGFRFTLDSVVLAHFASVKEGDRIVDLGTGSAVIPLLLSSRLHKYHITGVEIQKDIAQMAERSVRLNGLMDNISIYNGDFRDVHRVLGGGTYSLVTANPPYWSVGEGLVSPVESRAISCHEVSAGLRDFVVAAGKLLNYQGRFAIVYHTERLVETIALLRANRLEPRRIRFIHPFVDKPARHFLLESRKSAPADLKVLPPLIVYQEKGKYSQEILEWYGKGGDGVAGG